MPKVVVVYLSTSGNTKAMADAIVDGANSRNANAKAVNFHEAKIEDIIAADAIAIGSSTFHYKMLPPMEKFIEDLKKANVAGKVGAAFGSYGWSGEAPIMIAEKMRELGMNVIDPVLRIQYQPTEKDLDECKRLGKDIVSKVKKIAEKPTRAGSGSKLEDVSVREVKMGESGH
ncbi:MAG: flavodoxin domain-containing protein [Candidatus Methanoperedens sp.]|nr:flavodoxin domain-containing protein [Candidatus Methanoperedens sp. BLZ2]KAB2945514.1 MAG: FprA family A-type flavoprotein [Candidatus Methanoperedens sp.]MBZ0174764.1 flavodoxin domain-containing protein [Candidatus Methanoperedens nitroreducens]MCX9080109.1 flavodoxin domain-containing protein [Candidatus Methanoperedens sp.]